MKNKANLPASSSRCDATDTLEMSYDDIFFDDTKTVEIPIADLIELLVESMEFPFEESDTKE